MTTEMAVVGRAAAYVHLIAAESLAVRQNNAKPPNSIATIDIRPHGMGGSAHSDHSRCFRTNMRLGLHDIPGAIPLVDYIRLCGNSLDETQPRSVLAGYLSTFEHCAVTHLESVGCHVKHLTGRAASLDLTGNGYQIRLADGRAVQANTVVLATGTEAPSIPDRLPSNAPVTEYDGGSRFARSVSSADKVMVLGLGPGAIDVARYLVEELNIEAPVCLRSRKGLLSSVQTVEPPRSRMDRRSTWSCGCATP
jgi:uncharacterized NAD(P)/FAD-binding protein YdhS